MMPPLTPFPQYRMRAASAHTFIYIKLCIACQLIFRKRGMMSPIAPFPNYQMVEATFAPYYLIGMFET